MSILLFGDEVLSILTFRPALTGAPLAGVPAGGRDGTFGEWTIRLSTASSRSRSRSTRWMSRRQTRFWAGALGYERLYERPPYVVLGPVGRYWPRLVVQQVAALPSGKSRVHIDLRVRDPAGEVRRLEALGAKVDEVVAEAGKSWTVMVDPGGTVFCVCPAR